VIAGKYVRRMNWAAGKQSTGGRAGRDPAILGDVLILGATIVVADAGVISEADGVCACALAACVRPSLLPYLILTLAGFQDAKGLSYSWWYAGTLLLGILLVASNLGRLQQYLRFGRSDFRALAILATTIVVYGVVSSYIQDTVGIHEQDPTREPLAVGLLAIAMMVIGIAVWVAVSRDPRAERRVCTVFWLLLANGAIVSVARMFLGYGTFSSAYGAAQLYDAAGQLETATALGFPRLTGTYLTPTGFAVCILYILLLWEATRRGRPLRSSFVLLFLVVGCALSLMSLTKAVGIFVVIAMIGFAAVRPRIVMPSAILLGAAAICIVHFAGLDAIMKAFRFSSGTSVDSYRAIAWETIARNFTWGDWLFGTGMAYWPQFLERYTGFRLTDPHSYLLSIPGTYGVLGIAVYLVLLAYLINASRRATEYTRAIAIALIGMFFVVDVVNIPYVIGNTPITMQIWVLLAALGRGAKRIHPQGADVSSGSRGWHQPEFRAARSSCYKELKELSL